MSERADRAMAQAKKVAADPIKKAELMLAEGVGMSESFARGRIGIVHFDRHARVKTPRSCYYSRPHIDVTLYREAYLKGLMVYYMEHIFACEAWGIGSPNVKTSLVGREVRRRYSTGVQKICLHHIA